MTAFVALYDSTDLRERADSRESAEAADPMEPMERTDPTDAIEQADPMEPMERMDPFDPMERNESSDHNDHLALGRSVLAHLSMMPQPSHGDTCESWHQTPAVAAKSALYISSISGT